MKKKIFCALSLAIVFAMLMVTHVAACQGEDCDVDKHDLAYELDGYAPMHVSIINPATMRELASFEVDASRPLDLQITENMHRASIARAFTTISMISYTPRVNVSSNARGTFNDSCWPTCNFSLVGQSTSSFPGGTHSVLIRVQYTNANTGLTWIREEFRTCSVTVHFTVFDLQCFTCGSTTTSASTSESHSYC